MAVPDIGKFSTAFAQLSEQLTARLSQLPPGSERDQMQAFVAHLQGTHQQFLAESGKLDQRLEEQMQQAKANIEAAKKKSEEADAAYKEKLAKAQAAKTGKPLKELDPSLGPRLRGQLLEEYAGPDLVGSKAPVDELEWEWDDFPEV